MSSLSLQENSTSTDDMTASTARDEWNELNCVSGAQCPVSGRPVCGHYSHVWCWPPDSADCLTSHKMATQIKTIHLKLTQRNRNKIIYNNIILLIWIWVMEFWPTTQDIFPYCSVSLSRPCPPIVHGVSSISRRAGPPVCWGWAGLGGH